MKPTWSKSKRYFFSKRPYPTSGELKRPSSTECSPSKVNGSTPKKAKLNGNGGLPRRKASRKLAFDEDKTSPVSGTIIRELAEGEEVPAIRKGMIYFSENKEFHNFFIHKILTKYQHYHNYYVKLHFQVGGRS